MTARRANLANMMPPPAFLQPSLSLLAHLLSNDQILHQGSKHGKSLCLKISRNSCRGTAGVNTA